MAAAQDLVDINPQPTFLQTSLGRNFVLGVGIAIVLAVMVGVWMWSTQPEYRILFANVNDKDGGAITASLDQMAIPYKFSEGGGAIMVPSDRVHDARLKLASQGLPKGGNVGFELMENQKLGVSQFHEQINYQRSLEGELARSIQALGAVSAARVHLALPKPSVFVREQQKPTASVLLNLQPGRVLEQGQVSAIVHLVASSVSELPPSNVTVVDQNGTLLSDTSQKSGAKQLDPNQLKYVAAIQQNIVRQVESLITPLVGQGNVRAEATADVDFAQVDTAAESFKPNSPPEPSAIRSQVTSEAGATQAGAAGVPGALSNQPPGAATAPIAGAAPAAGAGSSGNQRKDATTNYEVDKTIRYEQKPMGGIKRLSVGVLVNYRRVVDPKTGKVSVVALTAAEVAQIEELVREAMGYSKDRGDSMTVKNAPFDGVGKPVEPPAEVPLWRDPANIAMAWTAARWAAGLLLIAFLYFRVLKPLMRPMLRRIDEISAVPPAPVVIAPTPEEAAEAAARQQLDEVGAHGTSYRDNLQMAKKMAQEDPRVVANVVKAWVGANE